MPRKVTLFHEVGHRCLRQDGARAGKVTRRCYKPSDLRLWNDQIGQAKARKQHLTKGACIKNASVTIQAFQGGQRWTVVAELAVVIVLNYPTLSLSHPLE